ncbi:MAG TPA: hypothetical protein VGC76_14150 [Pyrinomonadaceae bacterium]|jgi:hypothetical protein
MKNFDFSLYILSYNFVVAVLLMVASEKIGVYAGYFAGSYRGKISRATRIGILTFGACVALISFAVYIASYVLKL